MPPETTTAALERKLLASMRNAAGLRGDNETLRALVAKAIEVVDSEELKGMTAIADVHGYIYRGPTFDCDEARAALAEQGQAGPWLCTRCVAANVDAQKKCGHCGLTRQPEAPAQTDAPGAKPMRSKEEWAKYFVTLCESTHGIGGCEHCASVVIGKAQREALLAAYDENRSKPPRPRRAER